MRAKPSVLDALHTNNGVAERIGHDTIIVHRGVARGRSRSHDMRTQHLKNTSRFEDRRVKVEVARGNPGPPERLHGSRELVQQRQIASETPSLSYK